MTATEHVILVDDNDQAIGTAEKLYAHIHNLRHRAFSVFIFRKQVDMELLLQRRSRGKYHSPNLWTNTCCSHPRPGEEVLNAAERRLKEEMGICTPLKSLGWFHYIAHFNNGLVENEIDHVLVGFISDEKIIQPNAEEVQDYRWITPTQLEIELNTHPEDFTPWLKPAFQFTLSHLV